MPIWRSFRALSTSTFPFSLNFTKVVNKVLLIIRNSKYVVSILPMIALLQRVVESSVKIDAKTVGAIGPGLLVLIAVRPTDTPEDAGRLLERILRYRIFADQAGKMNL